MKQSRSDNLSSPKRTPWLAVLLATAVLSASTTSAMPPKFIIAGDYPTRSETARIVSKVDLDQAEIERLLELDLQSNDSNWLDEARKIYQNGMHSGPYASLTLTKEADHLVDLPDPVDSMYSNSDIYDPKHYNIYELSTFGMNEDNSKQIQGIVKTSSDSLAGKTIQVNYPEDSNCMVEGKTEDCFAWKGGIVVQGYGALDYTYNIKTDNKYSSSLKSFSEDEGARMFYCEEHGGCGKYQEYQIFYNFYGTLDYGNIWIEAAFANGKTSFPEEYQSSHGYADVDFSHYADISRNVAISTATVAMNVFTQINRLMREFGMDGCEKSTKDFSSYGKHLSMDSVVAAWDQAVALYAGSALFAPEGATSTPSTTGSLYFHMAQTLAEEFGAMEVDKETNQPVSIVNRKVMEAFKTGRAAISQSDCGYDGDLWKSYTTVLHKMRAPWIQGVLKATFEYSDRHFDDLQDREEQRGKAAAYLAALMPDLHYCSPQAAGIVMEELSIMWPHNNAPEKLRPDYKKVQNALEHQYQCLGVTCDEIGGFINQATGGYFEETRPCGGYGTMMSQRRESVTYNTKFSSSSSSKVSPSSSSFVDNHKSGLAASSFFMALAVFGLTLSALMVTVRDRSRRNAATRLVSGVISQADYWLSRRTSNEEGYSRVDSGYEVQLRPMSTPLQAGEESLI